MGTPGLSVPVLIALLDAGYHVAAVYTRPDRPTGRGKRLAPPEIKTFALSRGLPVFQPDSLRRDEEARRQMILLTPDVIVVAAYGLFLPADILDLPRLGCLNVHPSLLPRYRGPAPVASAILNGEEGIGVSIIRLDEGMDTGPILAQRETPIGLDETAGDLTTRLFELGAGLLVDILPGWERGEIEARPQEHDLATVTGRVSKEHGEIDWGLPAVQIARQVRAYHPWPGSFTRWQGKLLKIIEASPIEDGMRESATPGRVESMDDAFRIETGEGALLVRQVQLEGRRPAGAQEFSAGYRDFVGSTVGE